MSRPSNLDADTVRGFGDEWSAYDQTALGSAEFEALFARYFAIFPFDRLPDNAEGFDLGCGSGRWAAGVLQKVGLLHCIDASPAALAVARRRLGDQPNARFHLASVDAMPMADASQDFGYSLGVLHHVPDTAAALDACVRKLRPNAPFLVYLYYRFDNRPGWFAVLWQSTDLLRQLISRLPFTVRRAVTTVIASLVYWPLARAAGLIERFGVPVRNWPLGSYRQLSFYTMKTDALDRFGTRLERRFTRAEIEGMMCSAGLSQIVVSENEPFWVACGTKRG